MAVCCSQLSVCYSGGLLLRSSDIGVFWNGSPRHAGCVCLHILGFCQKQVFSSLDWILIKGPGALGALVPCKIYPLLQQVHSVVMASFLPPGHRFDNTLGVLLIGGIVSSAYVEFPATLTGNS
jgi:hypothetical protein